MCNNDSYMGKDVIKGGLLHISIQNTWYFTILPRICSFMCNKDMHIFISFNNLKPQTVFCNLLIKLHQLKYGNKHMKVLKLIFVILQKIII